MKQENICAHLRTKKMFISALADQVFAEPKDEFGHTCHCWCNRTMAETGPDDGPVGPEACQPGRECHES